MAVPRHSVMQHREANGTIVIDDILMSTSVNPVQNKVIFARFQQMEKEHTALWKAIHDINNVANLEFATDDDILALF